MPAVRLMDEGVRNRKAPGARQVGSGDGAMNVPAGVARHPAQARGAGEQSMLTGMAIGQRAAGVCS